MQPPAAHLSLRVPSLEFDNLRGIAAEVVALRPVQADIGGRKIAQIVRRRAIVELPIDGLRPVGAEDLRLEGGEWPR